MTVRIFKQAYVIPELGELGRTPDGAITNIGGTANPTFTVNGRGLLFVDGTTTDGSLGGGITLQTVYNGSTAPAIINLVSGKDLVFTAGSESFTFSSSTGDVSITANLVVNGLINGIDLATLAAHLSPAPVPAKHSADQISVDDSSFAYVAGDNVQETLASIDTQLTGLIGVGNVVGFHYIQSTPAFIWLIPHNQNSERVQVTVWDDVNHVIYPDTVAIHDLNTVRVVFNTAVSGRAVLMIY